MCAYVCACAYVYVRACVHAVWAARSSSKALRFTLCLCLWSVLRAQSSKKDALKATLGDFVKEKQEVVSDLKELADRALSSYKQVWPRREGERARKRHRHTETQRPRDTESACE